MSADIQERVIGVIRSAAGISGTNPMDAETALIGGGIALDSVAVLEILVALEKEFHLEMDADALLEAKALQTIGTLAKFIEDRTQRGA